MDWKQFAKGWAYAFGFTFAAIGVINVARFFWTYGSVIFCGVR